MASCAVKMGRSHRTIQLRAVLSILFLLGAHGARVSEDVALSRSILVGNKTRFHAGARVSRDIREIRKASLTGIGHDVCRPIDRDNQQAAVDRYMQKAEAIFKLADTVEHSKLAVKDFYALIEREKKFKSCEKLARDPEHQMTPELVGVILKGNYSLNAIGRKAATAVIASLKSLDLFKSSGSCGFYPELVDVIHASADSSPIATLHAQLFGPECIGPTANDFLDSLPDAEKQIAQNITEMSELAVRSVLRPAPDEALEQMVEGVEQRISEEIAQASTNPGNESLLEAWAGIGPPIWFIFFPLLQFAMIGAFFFIFFQVSTSHLQATQSMDAALPSNIHMDNKYISSMPTDIHTFAVPTRRRRTKWTETDMHSNHTSFMPTRRRRAFANTGLSMAGMGHADALAHAHSHAHIAPHAGSAHAHHFAGVFDQP